MDTDSRSFLAGIRIKTSFALIFLFALLNALIASPVLANDGGSQSESIEIDNFREWPADAIDWKVSPVDLSFLNAPEKPAGKRGFLKTVDDKLMFGDGTEVRFWGTNISGDALFRTPRDIVVQQARRLSALGFNLVRLHHHDSPWVDPNIFGGAKAPDTRKLDPAMLEKLDWWIKCLKDEGIYIWLDLHVGRQFKRGDAIDGFDEISNGRSYADPQGYNYVNSSIREAMKSFNEAYLEHLNKYTGSRYKDEAAIAAVLITNENDITHHFGSVLLPDGKSPWHAALYMKEAESFASRHKLSKKSIWRSWEQGSPKIFLNDLEYRFYADMMSDLRVHGLRVPIVTTSTWGSNPISSLPSLSAGDLIDVHAYGGSGELDKDPLKAANLAHWIAAAHIAGKPLVNTEWNVEQFPAPDRFAIPLFVGASGAMQGVRALMQYAYVQRSLDDVHRPSNWAAYNDPAILATMPASALLYRRRDVRESDAVYVYAPDHERLFGEPTSPASSVALRTAAEKGKLLVVLPATPELPWLKAGSIPANATLLTDLGRSLIDRKSMEAVSDTGELRRNWVNGTFTIDTPRTQAAAGRIGGKVLKLSDVEIALSTPGAVVAIQSLSDQPIRNARSILISMGARAIPRSKNALPYYSEPVQGRLAIRAPPGLNLSASNAVSGRAMSDTSDKGRQEIPLLSATYRNGWYLVDVDSRFSTSWLILQ